MKIDFGAKNFDIHVLFSPWHQHSTDIYWEGGSCMSCDKIKDHVGETFQAKGEGIST